MKNLIRFLWRGAVGGMIVPLLLSAPAIVYLGSISPWTLPLVFFYLAIPGAVVGLVLWILSKRAFGNIKPIRRAKLGVVTVIVLVVLCAIVSYLTGWGYQSIDQLDYRLIDWVRWFLLRTIGVVGGGGLAGIMCPARLRLKRAPGASNGERIELHEMGQPSANNEKDPGHPGEPLIRKDA